ncbi:MAG: Hsp20/alpha crystallin family protein, partial [Phycisphaerales bacterium]|nr:Hsp20/alpha crystallin family protein [Phycisphaerales bacterium]
MSLPPLSRAIPRSLASLQDEIGQMLGRMWHTGISTAPLDGQNWAPAIDVYEEATGYVLTAEVPGLKVDDIEVTHEDGELVIRGQKAADFDEEGDREYLKAERRYGSFARRIALPEPIVVSAITATCRAGLLTVHMPKKEPAKRETV